MLKVIFEWREDQEFGGEGWIPKGFPHFNVVAGDSIAHDVLEHFPDGEGSLKDEMLAFGSMLLIRGAPGWFSEHTNHDAAHHMGSDIGRFLQEELNRDRDYLPSPPNTKRLEEEVEELLQEILAEGVKNYVAEAEGNRQPTDTIIQRMEGWIRIGYRKAKQRWKGHRDYDLAYLFTRLSKAMNAPRWKGEYGQEMTVKVNMKQLKFTVVVGYLEDEHMSAHSLS